ncbi:MexE family multidrug efflux RND transporter periplasmic adaptor subunit [Gluconacetobacter liquefaciens]|uniref:Efflux RND transporter periplasmic adaptor subunit n=1 Tax=Gluconacetobacter liquefaciens TaxID=89584 RepID=A0A370GB17_GLULI|nr:efflux RND transporter periplasmic adaptor subunit [Gluconacetobacter liquefaciens]MBB2184973.1 efflux RND transporter periplasmic adaptor subunit [Gluconacetobacter liquefaciens]RDI40400.1 membrane fusion protein (multidrug efflux system) [Gluconacetobacter liquefaciens]GEB37332.1 MexE family multidrug efflux RND transporter periplasmic adaptor subunit [Gluconacetobacter liquefaciens]
MTYPRPHRAVLLAACASLALAGCKRQAAPPAPPPQQVGVLTLRAAPFSVTTDLPGRTEAIEIAQVRPQVNGVIQKRLFVEGSDVTAGQQLYQIDPSAYQATYDGAKAQLLHAQAAKVTAQAKLDRYGPLMRAHAVSRQDYDDALAAAREADADITQARASVESAMVNLNYTRVLAPISGRIGRSLMTVGALATVGQSSNLSIVTRLDPIYVDVNLPATRLLELRRELEQGRLQRAGQDAATVTLTLEDGSTYEQPGRLEFSEVNVDETTGTVVVRAVMPNAAHMLLPGMYVHAKLEEGVDPSALRVPQEAVTRNSHGDPTVMVVSADNKVAIRGITTGPAVGSDWIVTAGLKAGERIVVSGLQKIHPGDTVSPTEAAAQPAQQGKAG